MALGGAKRQAKAAGKPKKAAKNLEESKEGSHVESDPGEDMDDSHIANDEEIMNKYGFKQNVNLELALPTEEKEYILGYEMKFIDRNY